MEIRKGYIMGEKMTDEKLDRLFEQMDRETARMIANQHTPTKRTTTKKAPAKKTGAKASTKKK